MSSDILLLYRRILKHALVFPSKNRLKIVKEIKVTFRENKNLQDPIKLQDSIHVAIKGLEQLSQYTSLSKQRGDWKIDLENNPMPSPSKPNETK